MEVMPITTLVTRVLAELERLQYSALSQTRYRRFYQRILAYAGERHIVDYSEDIGRQFFQACYACDWLDLPHPVPAKLHVPLRGLAMLGDMQMHRMILRRHTYPSGESPPLEIHAALTAFAADCERRGYSSRSWRTRRGRLRLFGEYLEAHRQELNAVTASDLSCSQ